MFTIAVQALVVVGGYNHDNAWGLTSVVTYVPGSTAWTPLASLPQEWFPSSSFLSGLTQASASIMGGRLRVFGGKTGGGAGYKSEVIIYSHCQES